MASSRLVTLQRVTFQYPSSRRPLFSDLSECLLAGELVGLIGRNGSGKSTLGRLVAGRLQPSSGTVEHHARVGWVGQDPGAGPAKVGLAKAAGLGELLAAHQRCTTGHARPEDIMLLAGRWSVAGDWAAFLAETGLARLDDASQLSGGQRMLARLFGAFASDADFLVLDEPGNHLDRANRQRLLQWLARWRAAGKGVLLITHDRELLAAVDRAIEPEPGGLRRYGGGWQIIARDRAARLAAQVERLQLARNERDASQARLREQAERASRKQARGARNRRDANQSKLLLNAQRERAERTAGALSARSLHQRLQLQAGVHDAYQAVAHAIDKPRFTLVSPASRPVSVRAEGVVPPFGWRRPFDLFLCGTFRCAVTGPNGAGKSTLLRMLAGDLPPAAGTCSVAAPVSLLRQSLDWADPQSSLLQVGMDAAARHGEARLRQALAAAGLGAELVDLPVRSLSGGEQMRAALVLAAFSHPVLPLLLLDEPSNHLDLESVEALEHLLTAWPGSFFVASHDAAFLRRLELTHEIRVTKQGCVMRAA